MPCRSLQQRATRDELVQKIVKKFVRHCQDEKQLHRLYGTNRLLPAGTFKSRSLRNLFGGWAQKIRGRCITKKLASNVCKKLRRHFELGPGPDDEASRFQYLLQVARKRKITKPPKPCAVMDTAETLPMDIDVLEDGV